MNKEGFLILLELCTVYFAFQYAAIFNPAAGFQARRLLVKGFGGEGAASGSKTPQETQIMRGGVLFCL